MDSGKLLCSLLALGNQRETFLLQAAPEKLRSRTSQINKNSNSSTHTKINTNTDASTDANTTINSIRQPLQPLIQERSGSNASFAGSPPASVLRLEGLCDSRLKVDWG